MNSKELLQLKWEWEADLQKMKCFLIKWSLITCAVAAAIAGLVWLNHAGHNVPHAKRVLGDYFIVGVGMVTYLVIIVARAAFRGRPIAPPESRSLRIAAED